MEVPILKQGYYLIASIQSALTDADLSQLREALIQRVGQLRARGVIVDVTALDLEEGLAFLDRSPAERSGGRKEGGRA